MVDISAGTELNASYVNMLSTSSIRKEELGYKYNFTCHCQICALPAYELEISDHKRTKIGRLQWDVVQMTKNGDIKDAYTKSLEILEIAKDLGMELISILPQIYMDCYQLCCRCCFAFIRFNNPSRSL